MAKRKTDKTKPKSLKKPKRGTAYYPWKTWMTKRVNLRLVRGVDFVCAPYVMAQQIRNAASRHGVRVSIKIKGDEVTAIIERSK